MHLFNRFIRQLKTFIVKSFIQFACVVCIGYVLPASQSVATADELLEYKVKAAFIYNFIAFTQWPENTEQTLNLCLYGNDYFDGEIDKLQNRPVNNYQIKIRRIDNIDQLQECQAIFFSKSVNEKLSGLLEKLKNKPILTLADSLNAAQRGVAINMYVSNEKIVFEINLREARNSGLFISSRLLKLAEHVYQ